MLNKYRKMGSSPNVGRISPKTCQRLGYSTRCSWDRQTSGDSSPAGGDRRAGVVSKQQTWTEPQRWPATRSARRILCDFDARGRNASARWLSSVEAIAKVPKPWLRSQSLALQYDREY